MNFKDTKQQTVAIIIGTLLSFILLCSGGYIALDILSNEDREEREVTPDVKFLEGHDNQVKVTFIQGNTEVVSIYAEVADSDSERQKGLMDRTYLAADEGMLFVFTHEQVLNFWMKNTYIPLDIIFLNSKREIIKIHKNTIPLKEDIIYSSGSDAMFVVEVNSGFTDIHKLNEGDRVIF